MKNIHPEFMYQSRELGIQIEDTLGEPPDRRNYERVIDALIATKGIGVDFVFTNRSSTTQPPPQPL